MGRYSTALSAALIATALAGPAAPQELAYGGMTGVAYYAEDGTILPGTRVELTDEAYRRRVTVADGDGSYRFRALPPGKYEVFFFLPGSMGAFYQGVVVRAGSVVTRDGHLFILTPDSDTNTGDGGSVESSGEYMPILYAPMVDVVTTGTGTTYEKTVLRDSPLDPDVQSITHEPASTGHRFLLEGIDTTAGAGKPGLYYDYYAQEEITLRSSGTDVEGTTEGATIVLSVADGGHDWSGLLLTDWIDDSFVAEGQGNGYRLLSRWQAHADVGFPLVYRRAWFYGAFNHLRNDRAPTGSTVEPTLASDTSQFTNYTYKIHVELDGDTVGKSVLIGYGQRSRRRAPFEGLSSLHDSHAAYDHRYSGSAHKLEWQRAWTDRIFTNLRASHFGSSLERRARSEASVGSIGEELVVPGRKSQGKPQLSALVQIYTDRWGGHDWKLGGDWVRDTFSEAAQAPALLYLDGGKVVDRVRFMDGPRDFELSNRRYDLFVQDRMAPHRRLSLTLGARLTTQRSSAGASWLYPAPRLGVVFDFTGSQRTALKASYGRYVTDMADTLALSLPEANRFREHPFVDDNGNGRLDGPHELGSEVFGSGAAVTLNPGLPVSFSDQIGLSLEHEIADNTSVRLSLERKTIENLYGVYNRAQETALRESAIPCGDSSFPCPSNPLTGAPLSIGRVPDEFSGVEDFVLDAFPGSNATYRRLEVAFDHRFDRGFFVKANFSRLWRNELRSALDENQDPRLTDPIPVFSTREHRIWQNHGLDVASRQRTATWQGTLVAGLHLPSGFALSGIVKSRSGFPWAPIASVPIPGSGIESVFLDDLSERRSEPVTLVDLRIAKSFSFGPTYRFVDIYGYRLQVFVDVENLLNADTVTNFVLRADESFGRALGWVPPRRVKAGIGLDF